MARRLTHWVSPVQGNAPQTVKEVCDRARRLTPSGWLPRVLIPALYGEWWQADRDLTNTCGMEIRPADGPDLGWVKDRFDEERVEMGAWGVPRTLTYAEGQQHGWAASVVDLYVLDLEPYPGFLVDFDCPPEEFIAGFKSTCDRPPHISVVPQPSGIEPMREAFSHWAQWGVTIRPQCYWTDGEQLEPSESLPYLVRRLKDAGIKGKRIVPIYPANGGDHLTALLSKSRSDKDIWVLG